MLQCHFVHHQFYTDQPVIEQVSLWCEANKRSEFYITLTVHFHSIFTTNYMHIYLKLFYSLINSFKFPYICFGLHIDHLQGVTNYTYITSISSVIAYAV
jgi:hypothetical protein